MSKCVRVIEALEEYVLVPEEKALSSAHKLFQEFLEPEVLYPSVSLCVCGCAYGCVDVLACIDAHSSAVCIERGG